MTNSLFIAFVEDMAMIRGALSKLVEDNLPFSKVYQYCDGEDFVTRFPKQGYLPNIVLMDISMPRMDGYQTTGWLKANYPTVPVLVISMLDNEIAMIKAYNKGAKGFVSKHLATNTLLDGINEVISGNFYFNVGFEHSVSKKRLYQNGKRIADEIVLTTREEEIMKLMLKGKAYKEIASELCISLKTLETYKTNISNKLNIRTKEGLLFYAMNTGIL